MHRQLIVWCTIILTIVFLLIVVKGSSEKYAGQTFASRGGGVAGPNPGYEDASFSSLPLKRLASTTSYNDAVATTFNDHEQHPNFTFQDIYDAPGSLNDDVTFEGDWRENFRAEQENGLHSGVRHASDDCPYGCPHKCPYGCSKGMGCPYCSRST